MRSARIWTNATAKRRAEDDTQNVASNMTLASAVTRKIVLINIRSQSKMLSRLSWLRS